MMKNSAKIMKNILKESYTSDLSNKLLALEDTVKNSLIKKNWKIKITKENDLCLKKIIEDQTISIQTNKQIFNSRFEDKQINQKHQEKDIVFRNINMIIKFLNFEKPNKNLFIDTTTNEGGLLINHFYFNNNFFKGPKFEDLDDHFQILIHKYLSFYEIDKELVGEVELLSSIEFFKDMNNFNKNLLKFLN
jgi:hypothetical protein